MGATYSLHTTADSLRPPRRLVAVSVVKQPARLNISRRQTPPPSPQHYRLVQKAAVSSHNDLNNNNELAASRLDLKFGERPGSRRADFNTTVAAKRHHPTLTWSLVKRSAAAAMPAFLTSSSTPSPDERLKGFDVNNNKTDSCSIITNPTTTSSMRISTAQSDGDPQSRLQSAPTIQKVATSYRQIESCTTSYYTKQVSGHHTVDSSSKMLLQDINNNHDISLTARSPPSTNSTSPPSRRLLKFFGRLLTLNGYSNDRRCTDGSKRPPSVTFSSSSGVSGASTSSYSIFLSTTNPASARLSDDEKEATNDEQCSDEIEAPQTRESSGFASARAQSSIDSSLSRHSSLASSESLDHHNHLSHGGRTGDLHHASSLTSDLLRGLGCYVRENVSVDAETKLILRL